MWVTDNMLPYTRLSLHEFVIFALRFIVFHACPNNSNADRWLTYRFCYVRLTDPSAEISGTQSQFVFTV